MRDVIAPCTVPVLYRYRFTGTGYRYRSNVHGMMETRSLVLHTPASGRARNQLCAIRVGAPRHSMLTCMLLLLQLSGAVGQLCTILLIEATATAATDADAERAASAANGLVNAAAVLSSSMATIRTPRMATIRTLPTATIRTLP